MSGHPPHGHGDLSDRPLPWRVFGALHRAMHGHRQLMARKLAERDVPPGQALCMRAVSHHDGITQRDLAEMLGLSRPTVTVMLQKLERAGLIERRADEADQRYTRIYLTEQGRRSHEEMHALLDEIVDETIGPLSERDQREFERLLRRFEENTAKAMRRRGDPPGTASAGEEQR